MTGWRSFVAIPLGDELRRRLATAIAGWRDRPDTTDLRWTDAAALHLTVAFIGAVEPGAVDRLAGAIAGAVELEPAYAVATGDVGAFPSGGRARVAWYGVADPDGSLDRLAAAVRRAAAMPVDPHPFHPHVTLARTRGERGVDLRTWIRDADAPAGRLDVDTIHLVRSHLGNGPARYEVLHDIRLGGAVHA
jgi:2'-5' RNA ligase